MIVANVNAGNPANLMLHSAFSLIGRAPYSSNYRRYGYGQVARNFELFYPEAPWGYGSKDYTSLIMASKQYGSTPNYRVPKMVEFFEYTDKAGNSGKAHVIDAAFTADETLLVRAEAYALTKNYDMALRDMNYWIDSHCRKNAYFVVLTKEIVENFMSALEVAPRKPETDNDRSIRKALHPQGFTVESGTQEYFIQLILHMRRLETVQQGLRFNDIKRYGIEYSHEIPNGEPLEFYTADPRGAIQIPTDVIEAGMTPNPRDIPKPSAE